MKEKQKPFPEKEKLREFVNPRPALQDMLKAALLSETKR